jgi:hypothetical protein
MFEYDLDSEHSILHVQPKSAIERDDFTKLAKAVDPHIEATGGLAGRVRSVTSGNQDDPRPSPRYPRPQGNP